MLRVARQCRIPSKLVPQFRTLNTRNTNRPHTHHSGFMHYMQIAHKMLFRSWAVSLLLYFINKNPRRMKHTKQRRTWLKYMHSLQWSSISRVTVRLNPRNPWIQTTSDVYPYHSPLASRTASRLGYHWTATPRLLSLPLMLSGNSTYQPLWQLKNATASSYDAFIYFVLSS